MSNSAIRNAVRLLLASIGYQSDTKIVVFESDDWGAIRIPSSKALESYRRKFPDHELDHYQSYDGIESSDDISLLQQVLSKYSSRYNSPVFTLNFATANPRLDSIEEYIHSKESFVYESIVETYRRYSCSSNPLTILKDNTCFFRPQLHAREHLNATQWANGIIEDERLYHAFCLGIIGLNSGKYCAIDALNKNNYSIDRIEYLCDAAILFESLFGYASESFIPPCYVIHEDDMKVLAALNISVLQGWILRNVSTSNGNLKWHINLLGKENRHGQIQLIRNCQFEPSKYYHIGKDEDSCVRDAIADLERAFRLKQPAIFCTHRVNYTSRIDVGNREYSLRCLTELLAYIVREHHDVIFTTSDRLGKYIAQSHKSIKEDDLSVLVPETLS